MSDTDVNKLHALGFKKHEWLPHLEKELGEGIKIITYQQGPPDWKILFQIQVFLHCDFHSDIEKEELNKKIREARSKVQEVVAKMEVL